LKPAEPITLRADGAGLTVAPAVGGAVTRYRLERDGTTWEWLRPTPPEALGDGMPYQTAAFPLVPRKPGPIPRFPRHSHIDSH
jgi:hypothetical protein